MLGASRLRRHRGAAIGALVAVLVASIAGAASASPRHAAGAAPKPATAAQWKALIAKAKQEGSVTIYSVENPVTLANAAAAFKQLYGITVTINRQVDNTLVAQINAEESTGKAVADIWVASSKPYVYGASKNGWVVDAVGPVFFSKKFDRKTYMFGKAGSTAKPCWARRGTRRPTTGSINGSGLPTSAFRARSAFRIRACRRPSWTGTSGRRRSRARASSTKLAAQNPKIYTSTLPMTQAVASGEIIGAPCRRRYRPHPQGAGAPIELQGSPRQLERTIHRRDPEAGPAPGAAQLLADYMLSPEGQALGEHGVAPSIRTSRAPSTRRSATSSVNDFTTAKVACLQRPMGHALHQVTGRSGAPEADAPLGAPPPRSRGRWSHV